MDETIHNGEHLTAQLIAYLDGELGVDDRRQLEERLSEDDALRQRLQQYQQSWDLLDQLPTPQLSERFTQTTVEMVAIRSQEDAIMQDKRESKSRQLKALILGVIGSACCLIAFIFTQRYLTRDERQLIKDLPVIEHLDAYQYAESIDFVRMLQSENLFAEGGDDETK